MKPDAEAKKASLAEYRRKRDFSRTPEPSGDEGMESGSLFVVQKHAASHLHYDLRLQLHGALKSWAIPKGPSLDPNHPRTAMQTEDHPLTYAEFEGVIPEKQYGAGTVMIWDRGWWEPLGEGKKGYYAGKLAFRLHGARLRGLWSLVRTSSNGRTEWLLAKENDLFAGTHDLQLQNTSIVSGRTMEQITAQQDALWTREQGLVENPRPAAVPGAVPAELPAFIEPQLASPTDVPASGDEWLHELKYDGYRVLCRMSDGSIDLFSRRGTTITSSLPSLVAALRNFPVTQAWFDGEIVVFRPDGTASFSDLQSARRSGTDTDITYLLFDVMYLDGFDLRPAALRERKRVLAALVPDMDAVRYADHVEGRGEEFHAEACMHRLEGVVSKRADAPYLSGRSRYG